VVVQCYSTGICVSILYAIGSEKDKLEHAPREYVMSSCYGPNSTSFLRVFVVPLRSNLLLEACYID
jgi:hypothetical protein